MPARINPGFFLLAIIFLTTSGAQAQFHFINDKDGFVNVKETPETEGKIICQLNNGMVVYESWNEDTTNKNWIFVEFYLSKEQAKKIKAKPEEWIPDVMKDHSLFKGYIHKDRLLAVQENTPLERKESADQLLLFNRNIKVKFTKASFQKEQHKIQTKPEIGVFKIDGHYLIGLDGETPRNEIKTFTIEIDQKRIDVPKNIFFDLYEPNFAGSDAYSDAKGNLYIIMYNSDAAGSYSVIFILDNKNHLTRYVFVGEC
jgi:hypothetical protein